MDFSGENPVADKLNSAYAGSGTIIAKGTLTISDIAGISEDSSTWENYVFENVDVLTGSTGTLTLAIADELNRKYKEITHKTATLNQNSTWDNEYSTYDETKGLTFNVVNYTKIKSTYDEQRENEQSRDVLAVLNQTDEFGTKERTYKTTDAAKTIILTEDIGQTSVGKITVKGATQTEGDITNTSTINMSNNKGFVVGNGANVELNTVKITGTKTEDGSLINNTAGSVKLDNVEVDSNASDVISNEKTLEIVSSKINSGIKGTNGITKVSGTSIIDRISQKVVEVLEGARLEINSISATNGVTNKGTLNLTGTQNTNTITGTNGKTVISGNLENSGAINQSIEILEGAKLTTNADKIGGTVTNNADIELTGGLLSQKINGGNIIISTDQVVSSADKLNGDITNNSTLNLSGNLNKEIQGTGTTKVNSSLTLGASADISTGTLDLNNGTLTLSGDNTATTYIVDKLTNSGNLKLDIDFSNSTPVSDAINITTGGGTGTVTVDNLTILGTMPDSFTIDVLKGETDGITLALSNGLKRQYSSSVKTSTYDEPESYVANIDFDKTSFTTKTHTLKQQQTLDVDANKTGLVYSNITISDEITGTNSKDALATLNNSSGTRSMSATSDESSNAYKLTKNLGTTASGSITVEGRSSTDLGNLDMNGKTGFELSNPDTTVNLTNLNITNAKSETGSLINITNKTSKAILDGVTVAANTNNVISSNGTLGVKNSTVNAGINNTGTMNLDGTNNITSVTGANGTTNVKTGKTIISSLVQKLVDIVSGAKLIANGNITAGTGTGEGITNAASEGLEINNGKLTGNVTGEGSTKFSGTSSIDEASKISQNIKVADGTLTAKADSLDGEVTNEGTVDLTSGKLSTTITGGNAKVSGTVEVDDSTGSVLSAIEVTNAGSLKTNADNVTGTIANGGKLELTGGDIKNEISGTGSTTISGTVTNNNSKNLGNTVIIKSGSLATEANRITKGVENNVTNGLNLTGGDLASDITGTGSTTISGTVTNDNGKNIGNALSVTGSLKTDADKLGGAVANSGTVELTGGQLSQNITGGATTISGRVTNSASITGSTNIVSGRLENTNGQLANVTITSGSLTSSADKVTGTVVNNGTYNIEGGVISNTISGNGHINIENNVVNNAVNTMVGPVFVASGVEFAVGTGNVFNSSSSFTMCDGSTLNLQNGLANTDPIHNLIISSNDSVNVKMDWGDEINTLTPSVDGSLYIKDINLSNTVASTTDNTYIFTNLGDRVALSDSINLSGVTKETNNFVLYDNTTGKLTSYRNNLARAVKTESGTTTTYVMTIDETAGGNELDGNLTIQGNGHSIISAGIEVGKSDGSVQSSELTIKDANMSVTGDSITLYGGNKVHIVADKKNVDFSGSTGNAITLNKSNDGVNDYYAEADFDAGNKTITINNDIISNDKNNKVTFKSGKINFNGKFDPSMGVVSGAYLTRGSDDIGIDWTVTSGTLKYNQDSFLNRTSNTINMNGGNLDTRNGLVTSFNLGGFTLSANSNFYGDVDLANETMDNFGATPVTYTGGTLHVAGLNLISDAVNKLTTINFTSNTDLMGHVDYTGPQGLTAVAPIYKYNVVYNNATGDFDFTRYNTGGYNDFNPSVMAAPVAAQLGGYLTQLNSYDEAFRNMDMYMLMTKEQRQALKYKNRIASADNKLMYDDTLTRQENAEGWFRPYTTFENVPLKNGPKVSNVMYGTFVGGESKMYDLGYGWDGMYGAYIGYNGSHQAYDGIGIYQNGGTLGLTGMAYKGNFFTGLTINVGANGVEANTKRGDDHFAMLMSGIASKTGYNWELANGKFIIQPSFLMSYSMVNTFDYTNAAGTKIDADPLHAIQIQPEIKFIGNLKNNWQPYASVAMVWNVIDDTKFKANDVSLPELSVKPFVKYGVGVRKAWGERFTGFVQTYLTNGGRNGVGLQAGFTWTFGKDTPKTSENKNNYNIPPKPPTKIKLSSMNK